MTPVTLQTRELAARENDGIHVLLLWHPREDAVTVSVDDKTRGAATASTLPSPATAR